jgi:hypothetical protein
MPHRHDLVEYSCVNRAIQIFNHKLKKVANSFKDVTTSIIECKYEYNREYFSKHGMHLNTDEPNTEPNKLYNSTTKAVRMSKRSKKPPVTKKNYFLW